LNKPSTVVIGSTYPENISYPNNKNFHIVDNGKNRRKYSPIRISFEDQYDRNNEDLMILSNEKIKEISKSIKDKIGVSKVNNDTLNLSGVSKNGSSQNNLPINPSVMPGFQKPKTTKKKTIDQILELNDIKN
jgi:hypothetical protein